MGPAHRRPRPPRPVSPFLRFPLAGACLGALLFGLWHYTTPQNYFSVCILKLPAGVTAAQVDALAWQLYEPSHLRALIGRHKLYAGRRLDAREELRHNLHISALPEGHANVLFIDRDRHRLQAVTAELAQRLQTAWPDSRVLVPPSPPERVTYREGLLVAGLLAGSFIGALFALLARNGFTGVPPPTHQTESATP